MAARGRSFVSWMANHLMRARRHAVAGLVNPCKVLVALPINRDGQCCWHISFHLYPATLVSRKRLRTSSPSSR